jgi:DNA-directed RNA polymerase subunit RPC12/RpoP
MMLSQSPGGYVAVRCPQCGANLPSVGEQVVCQYCGARLIRTQPAAKPGQPAEKAESFVQGMRLKTITCTDSQGIGIEAFRMLMPAGWEFRGGVHWLMNNPGMPAVVAFQIYNPGGYEAFEVFPNTSFYWTNNPMIHITFPKGSLYFGQEVRPPAPAQQVLREIIIPRFRGQVQGIRILHQASVPELAEHARRANPGAPGGQTTADAAKVRFQYAWGGATLEEELFGAVEVTRAVMPQLMGAVEHIFWLADYLFSCRALAGRLDDLGDLFRTMLHSFRLNPMWFGRLTQVSQYLIQNQIHQIHQVGQLSRIISQTSNQISDMMMDTYHQRQEAMDRISTQFSQNIRGVDEYYDPIEGRGVELPGGYTQAWANSLGEYIVTDDPNFNPNIGSNLNWEPMSKS